MILRKELLLLENKYADNTALIYAEADEKTEISFAQLVGGIFLEAEQLTREPYERVAVIGESSDLWMYYAYGNVLAGKQTLLCDMLLPINEMAEVLKTMEIEKVYLSRELTDLKEELEHNHVDVEIAFWERPDLSPQIMTQTLQKAQACGSDFAGGNFIVTTSGTTSKVKGVVLDPDALLQNNFGLSEVLQAKEGDRVYCPLPMHHAYGLDVTLAFLRAGSTLYLGNMRRVLRDLKTYEPNVLLVVPTVIGYLHKEKLLGGSLRYAIVAGGKCEKKLEDFCREQGVFLQNLYGSSEASGGMAINLPGDSVDELTPIPGRTIEIAEDGEILVHAEWFMKEYYKAPQMTYEKTHDNCLFTEDLGYFDERGKLHINGRKNGMIAMENGDKIYCEETDEILGAMEGVSEAAVIYVEKKLIAVICPQKGVPDEVILEDINQYNAGQQLIRRMSDTWIRKSPLPRTSTGKMKRNELTQQYRKRKGID